MSLSFFDDWTCLKYITYNLKMIEAQFIYKKRSNAAGEALTVFVFDKKDIYIPRSFCLTGLVLSV